MNGWTFPAMLSDRHCTTAKTPIRHMFLGPRKDQRFPLGTVVGSEEQMSVRETKEEESQRGPVNTRIASLQGATAPPTDVGPCALKQPSDSP